MGVTRESDLLGNSQQVIVNVILDLTLYSLGEESCGVSYLLTCINKIAREGI